MIANHCDADGCDPVFHTLTDPDDDEKHFCSLNCVMLWAAAHSSPSEAHELK